MVKINGEEKKRFCREHPPKKIIFEYPKNKMKDFIEKKGFHVENKFFREKEEERIESKLQTKLNFYIKEEAMEKILKHCKEMAIEGKEALGFLIGDVKYWGGEYSVVYDIATASLLSSSIYVRFKKEAFEEIFNKLDEIEYEYVLIGWYHSHLGYSSFMSKIDMETQIKYFNKPFHASMVVDPIKKEVKVFRLYGDECVEIPYAIFR
ncbi:MAG TPA: hypothetical protein ENI33_02515 [Thermoplasmatales archaeon]|nr:hypothetical protein [Thermoplasmatales archaeon]